MLIKYTFVLRQYRIDPRFRAKARKRWTVPVVPGEAVFEDTQHEVWM